MKHDSVRPSFTLQPIGVVLSPFRTKDDVPKGLGARHDEEGRFEIFPEFASGLADIEGFSHLYVLWIFDRAGDYELLGKNPTDGLVHGVFAPRSPRRPNPLALSVVELLGRDHALGRSVTIVTKPVLEPLVRVYVWRPADLLDGTIARALGGDTPPPGLALPYATR